MSLVQYIKEQRQKREKKSSQTLLMTHVVCGYPSFEENWKALNVMQAAGVELVELQFPFSEPSADGPLFVQANQAAIASGVSIQDCFQFMQKVTQHFNFKVLMMGYYNTVFKYGEQAFLEDLKKSGGCGFILPDLPIEEAGSLYELSSQLDLSPIVLMTPTNGDARLNTIAHSANGFIYVVARKGVTGSQTDMNHEVTQFLSRCKSASDLPLAVGFGINSQQDIQTIGEYADIAIIGTAALKVWLESKETGLLKFLTDLREPSC